MACKRGIPHALTPPPGWADCLRFAHPAEAPGGLEALTLGGGRGSEEESAANDAKESSVKKRRTKRTDEKRKEIWLPIRAVIMLENQ